MLCIVLVAGLWLAVVENLPVNGKDKDHECLGQDPVVHFGYAYYIFLAAGVFSLTAAAFNLLCGRSLADRRRAMRLWLKLALILVGHVCVRMCVRVECVCMSYGFVYLIDAQYLCDWCLFSSQPTAAAFNNSQIPTCVE